MSTFALKILLPVARESGPPRREGCVFTPLRAEVGMMEERVSSDWVRAEAAASITITSALAVHSYAGPGLLESAYVAFLAEELRIRGIPVRTEVEIPIRYRTATVELGFRLDLLVDEALVVEVKACKHLLPVHAAQLLSYLRLGDRRIGLLINFHEHRLKNGIRRVINSNGWPAPR